MLWMLPAGARFLVPLAWVVAGTVYGLDEQQTKLFLDPKGWKYVAIFDRHNGIQTTHQCFVEGSPNQGGCRGTLIFSDDGQFTQDVYADGGKLERHGTYTLDGDQLTFKDELGTQDGPYTVVVNADRKSMRFSMSQTGVLIGADLKLNKASTNSSPSKKTSPPQ
jgi:hypothetical protein